VEPLFTGSFSEDDVPEITVKEVQLNKHRPERPVFLDGKDIGSFLPKLQG